jgi:hypothetical protein
LSLSYSSLDERKPQATSEPSAINATSLALPGKVGE